jgi:hypothetical protein
LNLDLTTNTAGLYKSSSGTTAASATNHAVIVLNTTTYASSTAAVDAADAFLTTDTASATYAVIWQDTLGNVHMSIGTEATGNDTGDDTDVEVVANFAGLTITGIATAIDTGDFTIF